ncbi:MAG: GerAB/ArcD/ProY family transporter [Clostridiales bacterium]|nr:GerAB/ArcD/ProY family transporter [Clostridiales bacterium]
MNLSEGKSGQQAIISMTCVAMVTTGLFSFYSGELYPLGNSTYVSFPVGAIIAGLVFLLAVAAIKSCNAHNLMDMFEFSIGKFLARIISAILIVYCITCAILPLNRFLNIMYNSFFINSNYFSIALFIIPVLAYFSLLGLEPICRTARALVWFLLAMHFFSLISEVGELDVYHIAPIMGDGLENTALVSLKASGLFLPALLFILWNPKSVHGLKFAKRAGYFSVPITAIVCGLTFLALAMMFTYIDLTNLYTPLYRYSMVRALENLILRMDKIMSFIWIMAVLLASSYYMYASSNIYAKMFKQNDSRPASIGLSIIMLYIAISSHLTLTIVKQVLDLLRNYSFLILSVPIIIVSGIAIVRASIINRRQQNEVGVG